MSDTIIGLLNDISNEEIVLPAIQRDFVWPDDKVIRLIDSILRGYPIGLALLWDTHHDIQYRPFVKNYRSTTQAVFNDNSSGRRLKLVLDGQQRLQSLYVALYGTYERKTLYFDLLSGFEQDDLAEDRFDLEFMKAEEARKWNKTPREEIAAGLPPFLYWPTAKLFSMGARERREFERDQTKLLKLSDGEQDLLQDNLNRFADHLSSKDILKTSVIDSDLVPSSPQRKSEADVCEIFVRINREGTNLSRSDLIFSLLKLNWKESAEALPEFVRSVNLNNSFEISNDFVIRCLFTVSDLGAKMDVDLLRTRSNVTKLQQNFDKCCNAIRATVDFVMRDCGCASASLVGGIGTLVPFVYYMFHLPGHEIPNSALRDAKRTFYLSAFSRTFSRYGEAHINAVVRNDLAPLLAQGQTDFPFKRIARRISGWEKVQGVDLTFMGKNPALALHLLQGLQGQKVQYASNSPELDHIFPKATLGKKGLDDVEINTLANFWILAKGKNRNKSDKHPSEYFKDVDGAVLKAALIDRTMLDYRKYKKFLRERGSAMLKKILDITQLPEDTFW